MSSFKLPRNPFRSQSSTDSAAADAKKSSASDQISAAATKAAERARAASTAASQKARELARQASAPRVDASAPVRVGFLGVSRDRKLLVWARDGEDLGPHTAVLSERYAALGRKMAGRADPPGWDDISEGDKRPAEAGGGALKAIKLPVCDLEGTTAYVVAFGAGYPIAKAQALCERLALLLGPMVDTELKGPPLPGALAPEGARRLREVLEREIAHANSSSQLQKVANQVESVRAIMEQNVEMILDRGEKIDALEDKSDKVHQASAMFRKQGRKLRRWHLMNQVKWGVAVGTMVTASVAIPIAILAAA
mmetsp:Transcript_23799/g.71393  ORF Transcript_23799/g.71393 Transcript_23799/m.71393 type:complete len:309 (+) Transcript_23799:217-1143(+)